MAESLSYVIITPARNEAPFIELTLKSMVAQTHPPLKWVIVSDGSTDGTDEIVKRYLPANPWIELVRMPERKERNFAGKVHAFNAGLDRVEDLEFNIVGNLDADVSFEPDHFQYLIGRMGENPQLGVAGAPFREGTYQYDYRFQNIENVWGGCQLFRRDRRLHAAEGRLYRSCRGNFCPAPGMADAYFYRKGLLASSPNGYSPPERFEG
jgi:glycosyltransferase involved in cell wall biosynthesis